MKGSSRVNWVVSMVSRVNLVSRVSRVNFNDIPEQGSGKEAS